MIWVASARRVGGCPSFQPMLCTSDRALRYYVSIRNSLLWSVAVQRSNNNQTSAEAHRPSFSSLGLVQGITRSSTLNPLRGISETLAKLHKALRGTWTAVGCDNPKRILATMERISMVYSYESPVSEIASFCKGERRNFRRRADVSSMSEIASLCKAE